ncbi:23S rRNA (uracil(1939)-C(5))-methyltransferase RlmD [Paenibacillus dendrobii]
MAERTHNKAEGREAGGGQDKRAGKPAMAPPTRKKAAHPKQQQQGKPHSATRSKQATYRQKHPMNQQSASAETVKTGDRIIVTIKRIGINGEGVGYYRRKAVFIDGALPDEVVKAKVTRVESGYLNGEIIEIEKRSAQRQEPPCPVYGICGGCQLQHMTYASQLQAKEEIVRESFQRYAKLQEIPLRPIFGMDNPWGYRNKAQLQAGREGEDIIAGLYAAGSHRLIDISGCPIQHPVVNRVMEQVKEVMEELQIPVYNERNRDGAVRTIVARVGQATGKVQLTFITSTDRLPDSKRLVELIRERLPMVITVAQNIHKGKSPLVFGNKTVILWGSEQLEESLGDVRFALSPRAFFQLNPEQTVKLYNAVQEAADLSGSELVVDAYCGTGTIGLWLAPFAQEVRGIELIPEAVLDARDNAKSTGVDNAHFYEGRAEQLLPDWVSRGIRPDVVVVDPPRTGCERPLLDAIVKSKPKRLVYVSCNPATLAKDCQVLLSGGYKIEWVQPVDMFPQTSHVECCALLIRK